MATTTITDLPSSRALDYKAMSAIRGALGDGNWCLYAFVPYDPRPPIVPIVVYETNFIADQMNLLVDNVDIGNVGAGASVNVNTHQNQLNLIAPVSPHH